VVRAAKELHFNKNMEALKKMQAGADKLATVVGVTLGPKVRPHSSSRSQKRDGGFQGGKQTHPGHAAHHPAAATAAG
jgi:hypothetical protein